MTNEEILNQVWDGASPTYQQSIPQATRDNIVAVGNAIMQYELMKNEFVEALINKIGLTVLDSFTFDNPLARFKKQPLALASDIEDVWIEEAQAHAYDETGNKLFDVNKPTAKAIFHRRDRKLVYKVTIYERQLAEAFTRENGLNDFVARAIGTLSTRDEFDEYVMMKELLGEYHTIKDGYYNRTIPTIVDQETADIFMVQLLQSVKRILRPAKKFNKQNVLTRTSKKRLVVFIDTDIEALVDVFALSKAFNQQNMNVNIEFIGIEDLVNRQGTPAILMDTQLFEVRDILKRMTSMWNPLGLYWNYFLHHWALGSMSQFKNAIRFTYQPTKDGREIPSPVVFASYYEEILPEFESATAKEIDAEVKAKNLKYPSFVKKLDEKRAYISKAVTLEREQEARINKELEDMEEGK